MLPWLLASLAPRTSHNYMEWWIPDWLLETLSSLPLGRSVQSVFPRTIAHNTLQGTKCLPVGLEKYLGNSLKTPASNRERHAVSADLGLSCAGSRTWLLPIWVSLILKKEERRHIPCFLRMLYLKGKTDSNLKASSWLIWSLAHSFWCLPKVLTNVSWK